MEREGERERENSKTLFYKRERELENFILQRERERELVNFILQERENSKTLFYKNCSLGSVKT